MATTAVIPNWNGETRLRRVLEDLARQTSRPQRVIVVDNGSTDQSVQAARDAGADVIRFEANSGFAPAVNAGVSAATTPLVAILNNDVELAPEWLERLESAIATPSVWFATGKIYTAQRNNVLDGAFDALSRGACAWRCGHGMPDGPVWNRPTRIFFAPLTAALFRKELWDRLGGLDERFESYLEDIDLGFRCALAGCAGQYVPGAEAWHWGSATLGVWHPATVRRISRNQVFLVAKHFPRDWPLSYGWPVLAGQLLWGVTALRRGQGYAWLQGKLEGIRGFAGFRTGEGTGKEFSAIITASEQMLREYQFAGKPDRYWRLYFALT